MQLFYRTKGDPTLPPLIILHGLWGASDNWLQVAEFLCDNFHVILPDLRNHGRSPHSDTMNYEIMSQDLQVLIKELNLSQKPFIVGHSMGGKVLMTLLLREPESIKKAVILDIAPVNYLVQNDSMHQMLTNFMLHFPLSDYLHRETIHRQIRSTFSSETFCQILFKNIRKGANGFEWKVNIQAISENMNTLCSWPISLSLSNVSSSQSLLFIRGEKSTYVTEKELETIFHFFPSAQIETLMDAGHFLHTDQPTLLVQTLLRFLKQHLSLNEQIT